MTKGLEIARFELAHQLRRRATWVLVGLFMFPLIGVTIDRLERARNEEVLFNAPLQIAQHGVILGLVALLVLAAVVGDAATRDIRTRLEPLMRAAPVGRAAYLGGRFLGVFAVAAILAAVVPLVHVLVPLFQPELAAGVVGPLRVAAYLQSYVLLMLPSAFAGTALMFTLATLARHSVGSWLGAALVFAWGQFTSSWFGDVLGRWDLAGTLDPTGINALYVMRQTWSPVELGRRLVGTDSILLWNRGLWLSIACALLLLAYGRFESGGDTGVVRWWQRGPLRPTRSAADGRGDADPAGPAVASGAPVAVPRAPRDFGPAGRMRQILSITRDSLREMTPRWVWLALPLLVALQMAITLETLSSLGPGSPGSPVLPTSDLVLRTLLGPDNLGDTAPPVVLAVILLPIVLAGELVWRERDANVAALADAAPVPDGVRFVGKVLGLWLVLATLLVLLMLGAALAQVRLGWTDFEPGLYGRILGLRLVRPLLFGLFALSVHVLVNHKHLGHVIVLLLVAPLLGELLGLEHPLLLIGDGPSWRYSPISGFGPYLGPVLWFDLYWAAWALFVALVARLFWVRGEERGLRGRVRAARRHFGGRTRAAIGAALVPILLTGGFIFYNTNVLNAYRTSAGRAEEQVEYERRYRRYEGAPQPQMTATELHVEIHPDRREATVTGVHILENRTTRPLDTLHVATSPAVETGAIELDRSARATLVDDDLGHRIYVLDEPLRPGDSLRLAWRVRHAPRGFPARSLSTAVVRNGSFFVMADWMPLVGYQLGRQLLEPAARREHGLPPWAPFAPLDDPQAPSDRYGIEQIDLTATIGTAAGQIAVAPGALVRSWSEDGRRYFRYETNAPIGNGYAIFSADYEVGRGRWDDVDIEVLHHPAHDANVPTMLRGMEASLAQLTERFGPFPYDVIRMVEYPSAGGSLHAASATIWYQELFSLFDPGRDPRRIDLPFAVVAHEVAHQFQPVPARMEGRALLSESFAWYAAMGVIEAEYGTGHLERFLDFMRSSYLTPRSRADVPLLRANDSFLAYRKGPFAMYALREYVGQDRVDLAWRRLRERHASHEPPFATSLDLYRELQEVTPDSLHTLLGDLLERNTFWELSTEGATSEPTGNGEWRLSLEVTARKVTVDTMGATTEVPMDDLVEIGVYAAAGPGEEEEPLYLARHRIRDGDQTIVLTVPRRPARAGIDPRHLLIDVVPTDNVVDIHEPSPARD